MILNSKGNQILSNVSQDEFKRVISIVQDAILENIGENVESIVEGEAALPMEIISPNEYEIISQDDTTELEEDPELQVVTVYV